MKAAVLLLYGGVTESGFLSDNAGDEAIFCFFHIFPVLGESS